MKYDSLAFLLNCTLRGRVEETGKIDGILMGYRRNKIDYMLIIVEARYIESILLFSMFVFENLHKSQQITHFFRA